MVSDFAKKIAHSFSLINSTLQLIILTDLGDALVFDTQYEMDTSNPDTRVFAAAEMKAGLSVPVMISIQSL